MEISFNRTLNNIMQLQKNFMESKIFDATSVALDIGIAIALPDFIEEEVMELKDSIFKNGLVGGIKECINNIIDFGKDVLGVVTNDFKSLGDMKEALKKGGTIDTLSKTLDKVLEGLTYTGIITNKTKSLLKKEKNTILNNIDDNLSKEFNEQEVYLNNIKDYMLNWNKAYENKNFEEMKDIYSELKEYINDIVPLEDTLQKYKKIENLQSLIESKNGNFELSQNEIELSEVLLR